MVLKSKKGGKGKSSSGSKSFDSKKKKKKKSKSYGGSTSGGRGGLGVALGLLLTGGTCICLFFCVKCGLCRSHEVVSSDFQYHITSHSSSHHSDKESDHKDSFGTDRSSSLEANDDGYQRVNDDRV